MKIVLTEKDIHELIDKLETENLSDHAKKVIRELIKSLPLCHEEQHI